MLQCGILNGSMSQSNITAFVSPHDTRFLFESFDWVIGKGTLQAGKKHVLEADKSVC